MVLVASLYVMAEFFDYANLDHGPAVEEQTPLDMPPLDPLAPPMQETDEIEPNATLPHDERHDPWQSHWKCIACGAGRYHWQDGRWKCASCNSTEFYDTNRPTTMQTQTGTWMYMPHGSVTPEAPPEQSPASSRSRRRRTRKPKHSAGAPNGPPDGHQWGNSEQAESESMTFDPSVEPSVMSVPVQLTSPSSQRGATSRPSRPQGSQAREEPLLAALRRLVQQRSHDDDDWNSRKGPERGIRWRTGQHPPPPQWKYDHQDLRGYAKFAKKVKIWQIQMQPFASSADQALLLWGSLTGDAEQELEHLTIEEVHCATGVETILAKLRIPFEQRAVFQKRKFLHDFESLRRYNGEGMRTYIQRFRRSIRNLQSLGVDVTMSYDSEALGSRLLDRAGLGLPEQRMVLIGTQQRLDLEVIAEALVLQYPEVS